MRLMDWWLGFIIPNVGFIFWRYGFHGSMDEFHFWWCGWPDFFVPWFGGCGFCGLVVGNLMVVWVVGRVWLGGGGSGLCG